VLIYATLQKQKISDKIEVLIIIQRKNKDRNYGKYQIDFMISFGLGRSKGLIDNI